MKTKIYSFLLCAVLSFFLINSGAKIRSIGYDKIPNNKIFDERDYALQGLSIRKSGIPLGWSSSGSYDIPSNFPSSVDLENLNIIADSVKPNFRNYRNFPKPLYIVKEYDFGFGEQQIKFVQPFLDHPPLGGVISSLGLNRSTSLFNEITPDKYRRPMLIIAVINSIILFLFISSYLNPFIGLLSVAVYNHVPTYMLSSRYALLENISIPFMLLSLWTLLAFKNKIVNKSENWYLYVIVPAFLSGVSVLVKESSFGLTLGLVAIMISWKLNKKAIATFIGSAILPIFTYLLWALYLSPKVLASIFNYHTGRSFSGSLGFLSSVLSLNFENFPLDGWWIWGFISFVVMFIILFKKFRDLLIPITTYLLFITFTSSANFPWYYLGLIPFLSISVSIVFWELIVKNTNLGIAIFFALIPLSSSFFWGYLVFHPPYNATLFKLIIVSFISLAWIRIKFKSSLTKLIWIAFLIVITYEISKWNRYSLLYIIDNWGNLPNVISIF